MPQPLPHFQVCQAVIFFGWRIERLGQEVQVLDKDRELAGLRPLQLAIDTDDVPQVEALGQVPVLFADLVAADEQLDLPRPIADLEKNQFSGWPLQHDPPCGSDLRAMLDRLALAFGSRLGDNLRLAIANLGDRHVTVEPLAPRVVTQLANFAQLFAPGIFRLHQGVFRRACEKGRADKSW